jgi:photosystem II stability/assembly factor-like uncharacterized protein
MNGIRYFLLRSEMILALGVMFIGFVSCGHPNVKTIAPENTNTVISSQTFTSEPMATEIKTPIVTRRTDQKWVKKGLQGETVKILEIALTIPPTLYAATISNWGRPANMVFKSADGGENWIPVIDGLTDDTIIGLTVDPVTPTTLYLWTQNGLFKSTNGGEKWIACKKGLPQSDKYYVDVKAFAIDPLTPTTLYASVAGEVYKSINGGEEWYPANRGLCCSSNISALVVDPLTPTTVYAASMEGVFKSTNGGGNWNSVNTGLTNSAVEILAIDPATPSTLYAGTVSDGVFTSTDRSENWYPINSGLDLDWRTIAAFVIDSTKPTTLYAAFSSTVNVDNAIYWTTNGGKHWSLIDLGLRGTYIADLVIDSTNPKTLYAATEAGIFGLAVENISL